MKINLNEDKLRQMIAEATVEILKENGMDEKVLWMGNNNRRYQRQIGRAENQLAKGNYQNAEKYMNRAINNFDSTDFNKNNTGARMAKNAYAKQQNLQNRINAHNNVDFPSGNTNNTNNANVTMPKTPEEIRQFQQQYNEWAKQNNQPTLKPTRNAQDGADGMWGPDTAAAYQRMYGQNNPNFQNTQQPQQQNNAAQQQTYTNGQNYTTYLTKLGQLGVDTLPSTFVASYEQAMLNAPDEASKQVLQNAYGAKYQQMKSQHQGQYQQPVMPQMNLMKESKKLDKIISESVDKAIKKYIK